MFVVWLGDVAGLEAYEVAGCLPCVIAAIAVGGHMALAETITVCADGCDFASIQAAVDAAVDGDVIQLAAETYYEGSEITVAGKAVAIIGEVSGQGDPLTVVMGNGSHRLLRFAGIGTEGSVVEGVSFQLGRDPDGVEGGGGILADSTIISRHCEFVDNDARGTNPWSQGIGGGTRGPIRHEGCLFLRNRAYYGGGSARGTYSDCDFIQNECISGSGQAAAPRGAAIWRGESASDCTFSGNAGSSVVDTNLYGCVILDGVCYPGGRDVVNCRFEGSSVLGFCDWSDCAQTAVVIDCYFANGIGRPGFGSVFQGCIFEGERGIGLLGGQFEDCDFNNGVLGSQIVPEMRGCTLDGGEPSFRDCRFLEACPGDPVSWFDLGGNLFAGREHAACEVDFCLSELASNAGIGPDGLGILVSIWGNYSPCDVDLDGVIGAAELGRFLASWGQCP